MERTTWRIECCWRCKVIFILGPLAARAVPGSVLNPPAGARTHRVPAPRPQTPPHCGPPNSALVPKWCRRPAPTARSPLRWHSPSECFCDPSFLLSTPSTRAPTQQPQHIRRLVMWPRVCGSVSAAMRPGGSAAAAAGAAVTVTRRSGSSNSQQSYINQVRSSARTDPSATPSSPD